ncbi:MAG: beta-ketoacyl-ACP synthase II [Oscillospiraceae bacterium]|nr:beta-ketoacyl-ACP synthase II [Oscillospiraceae bacterium]
MSSRVVVTGIGMITSAGKNVNESWQRVLSGDTAIDNITRFDTSNFKVKLAAEIKDFDPAPFVEDRKDIRRLDRFAQYALAAVHEAVTSSGIDFKNDAGLDKRRCGIIFGSGIGGIETLETEIMKYQNNGEKGASRVSPLYIPMLIANIAAGHISIKYGLEGHGFCPVTACATSAHAVGEAFRAIKHGYADIIIAGGSESAITPTAIAGFQNTTTMSTSADKNAALLAFDKRRDGFIMGEGSGALIMENYESAKKRGAVIYGEVVGYCANFDAFHITSPEQTGKGAANAILGAIDDAKIDMNQIGYINAHGTGTAINDKTETLALKRAFGENAYNIPVSSTKGVTGHMLGATGAVESIFCIKTINDGILPPTANLREIDPECDLDYIPLNAREKKIDYALSTSLGFGSTNAVLIIKKFM